MECRVYDHVAKVDAEPLIVINNSAFSLSEAVRVKNLYQSFGFMEFLGPFLYRHGLVFFVIFQCFHSFKETHMFFLSVMVDHVVHAPDESGRYPPGT